MLALCIYAHIFLLLLFSFLILNLWFYATEPPIFSLNNKARFQELHHLLTPFGSSFIYTVKDLEPIDFKQKLPKNPNNNDDINYVGKLYSTCVV